MAAEEEHEDSTSCVEDANIPAESETMEELFFFFRDRQVPVKLNRSVTQRDAEMALDSEIFTTWVKRCEKKYDTKRIEIHSITIESVDEFGERGVSFIKLRTESTLVDEKKNETHSLPGVCVLRGSMASVLIALICEDGSVYNVLVERPRISVGQVSALDLPSGLIDDYNDSIIGDVFQQLEDVLGINVKVSELKELSSLITEDDPKNGHFNFSEGISISTGGSDDEFVKMFYLEKSCTLQQLEIIQTKTNNRICGYGPNIFCLQIIPMNDVWKKSGDSKAIISIFLLDQLRKQNKIPSSGEMATPIMDSILRTKHPDIMAASNHGVPAKDSELMIELSNGSKIPQLAFDTYRVPSTEEGEEVILEAIAAGYRHFDTAEHYRNEAMIGRALQRSGIPREEFFIVNKVWNDVQKLGRFAVRKSIEKSLSTMNFGTYFDLFLVHWPVPRYYIETYKELESLHEKGILRNIGISNFNIMDYVNLTRSGNIQIQPSVIQMEVSPTMYRKKVVDFFQEKNIVVYATKSVATNTQTKNCLELAPVQSLATKHSVTPAQIIHRWCYQKGLVVAARTWSAHHMRDNRAIAHFSLSNDDMGQLDKLTDEKLLKLMESRLIMRKASM